MADIEELEQWDNGVYQLETTDPVEGGADGVDNTPHKALANRTKWLKKQIETVQNTISNFSFAALTGSATQKFKVATATTDTEAVNKLQMESAIASGVSVTGFKNLIINGCLRVNQRNAAAINTTANAYNFDRWYFDGTNFIQYVEDKNVVLGGTYTLSWVGTATATVDGSVVANGSQVTLTANTQVEIKFSSSDFSFVQLEYGNKKTNFENRAYNIEELLCMRYYEKSTGQHYTRQYSSGNYNADVYYKVRKRVLPTVTSTKSPSSFSVATYGNPNDTVDKFHANSGSTGKIITNWSADAETYPV